MALGEVTAYIAGMATAIIVREEEIKVSSRLRRFIQVVTSRVQWLMDHYGLLTLFVLALIPNVLFEVAGWTAGASRFPFWKFMAAVTLGKVLRALALAYIGERLLFG
jgi:membrane protein YqaA with SNARE-associated domain